MLEKNCFPEKILNLVAMRKKPDMFVQRDKKLFILNKTERKTLIF